MHDDQMPSSAQLSLTLTGSFDADFIGRLGEALVQIARAKGKRINGYKLTPQHVLLVLSALDDGGQPQRGPDAPSAGPDGEPQQGVDNLVERALERAPC